MALMKAMSTSLIVRNHEALATLKSCPMTTIYKPTLNWCFGRWLNRWLFACDGKKRRPNWSPFMPPTPKSRGFRPFTASKRLSLPNPPRFYPIRFCGSFAPSTKEALFGRLVFFMENLSRSLFNSFLSSMIQ